jgi:hypothetical protein
MWKWLCDLFGERRWSVEELSAVNVYMTVVTGRGYYIPKVDYSDYVRKCGTETRSFHGIRADN